MFTKIVYVNDIQQLNKFTTICISYDYQGTKNLQSTDY